jgi:ECF sigma factor
VVSSLPPPTRVDRLFLGTATMAARDEPQEITRLLLAWNEGDESALEKLVPLVYQELRRLAKRQMGRERPDHTLQTTALGRKWTVSLCQGVSPGRSPGMRRARSS